MGLSIDDGCEAAGCKRLLDAKSLLGGEGLAMSGTEGRSEDEPPVSGESGDSPSGAAAVGSARILGGGDTMGCGPLEASGSGEASGFARKERCPSSGESSWGDEVFVTACSAGGTGRAGSA